MMSKGRPGSVPPLNISWNRGRSPVGGVTGVCIDTVDLEGKWLFGAKEKIAKLRPLRRQ